MASPRESIREGWRSTRGAEQITASCTEVRDDGPGLDGSNQARTRKAVGLTNIQSRLEQLYDGEHRFALENHPGGGTVVRLSLPFRRGDGVAASQERSVR
jgi:sensor histidine kinase YesM